MLKTMGNIAYTDDEAEGAFPNGSRVVKSRLFDPVEAHPVGTTGKVLGSIALPPNTLPPDVEPAKYLYWIIWDPLPGVPVCCVDLKLKRIE